MCAVLTHSIKHIIVRLGQKCKYFFRLEGSNFQKRGEGGRGAAASNSGEDARENAAAAGKCVRNLYETLIMREKRRRKNSAKKACIPTY